MLSLSRDPVKRRNLLLAVALAIIVFTFVQDPETFTRFRSVKGFIQGALILFSGVMLAAGIRSLALDLFKIQSWPWYAHPGGLVLLSVCIVVYGAMVVYFVAPVLVKSGVPAARIPGLLFLSLAAAISATAIQEWPTQRFTPMEERNLEGHEFHSARGADSRPPCHHIPRMKPPKLG